jgi:CRISPR/Cas system-associated protein Csm6
VPLPDGIEIWAPLIILPLPEDLDPERALSLLIEAVRLSAEHTDKGDRADLAKLQHQLEQYGNKLVLPWQTRMIASAGFFKKTQS